MQKEYPLPEERKYARTNLLRSSKSVSKKHQRSHLRLNIIKKKLLKKMYQVATYQDIYCNQEYAGCQYDSRQPSHRSGLLCQMQ